MTIIQFPGGNAGPTLDDAEALADHAAGIELLERVLAEWRASEPGSAGLLLLRLSEDGLHIAPVGFSSIQCAGLLAMAQTAIALPVVMA